MPDNYNNTSPFPDLGTPPPPDQGPSAAADRFALPLPVIDQALDRAFAATLSAAVYTDNVWMLQTLDQPWESTPNWRIASSGPSDPTQIERSCLLKEFFSPVEGVNIPADGQGAPDPITHAPTAFSFEHGVFFFGELACAALVERKRMDGSTVMELCFRGTESETTGDPSVDRKNLIGGYFLSAYGNLEGHYERHRMLIDEAVNIVNRRIAAGENISLQVSGHSLGGSMVELFMKKDAARVRQGHVVGCTFGSPGIGDKQNAFSMLVKGFARLIRTQLGLLTSNARLASADYLGLYDDGLARPSGSSAALTQYIDPDDPVPKLGLLGGYVPTGNVYFSRSREFSAPGVPKEGSLLDIGRHSVSTYEKTRAFAFLRLCKRNARPGMPFAGILDSTIDRIELCNQRAAQLNERAVPFIERVIGHRASNELAAAVTEGQSRQGMISANSPNSFADTKKFENAIDGTGQNLLGKLAARRALSIQAAEQKSALDDTKSKPIRSTA